MKVIAAIDVHLRETPLGTRSRLPDRIAGETVLRRTVERVRAIPAIQAIYLLCPQAQGEEVVALAGGPGVTIHRYNASPPGWRNRVQSARKWSLDGWRGGLGGATYFDEFVDARLLAGLLQARPADLVLCVPGSAALLDPALAQRMIEQHTKHHAEVRMTFTQAPPGIAGILLDAGLIGDLARSNTPIGWTFAYRPDSPQKDLIFQPCCLDLPPEVRYAVGRVCADTDRAFAAVAQIAQERADGNAEEIGRWLIKRESSTVDALPREVEIELTTDDPYPDGLLQPRGVAVGSRGAIELSIVKRVVDELIERDDSLLVLGGFGDPLRHPEFCEVLSLIRSIKHEDGYGLFGLAVRTTGVDLCDSGIDALIRNGVDVVEITLDAWTPTMYVALQTPTGKSAQLDAVIANLDQLAARSREQKSPRPILVPSMVKAIDNLCELDEFHDGWLRRVGTVCISGYSHRAGQRPDRSVVNMAPAPRVPCRRLRSRCVVLADGRVTPCEEDFRGVQAVGNVHTAALSDLWTSNAYGAIREAHRSMHLDSLPLCSACHEWHRP